MGYFGKIELKEKALELRRKGFSYKEIQHEVPVSKDTLSRWLRDIELTDEQKQTLIDKKLNGQKRGSVIAAENKKRKREEKIRAIYGSAKKDLGKISVRDNFIFGLALYAGEGGKTDGKGAFTNSNPYFIKYMTWWFKTYCGLQSENLKGAIWIHEENNALKAKGFWSNLTGIPVSNFHKSYIVRKNKKTKFRKNIHQYGVFSIRFYNSDMQRKILGWISVFLGDKIAKTQQV